MTPNLKKIKLLQNINKSGADFKPEVIAALLIDQGFRFDQFIFLRKGGAKRGFSKDISEVNLKQLGGGFNEKYVEIGVNRRGIYDGLPEGIFHKNAQHNPGKSKQQVLQEFNKHREEEFFARRFFCLFEVECDRTSVLTHRLELYYDKKSHRRNFVEVFSEYWPVLSEIPLHKAVLFLKMVPFFSSIRNSFLKIADVISLITGVDIEIGIARNRKKPQIAINTGGLGKVHLGQNFVLKGYCEERLQDIEVLIGPVDADSMQNFLPGGVDLKIINCLSDNLFSANKHIDLKYRMSPESNRFILGRNERRVNNNFLGINTVMVN
ncbi:type VI secretion system (T6SS) VasB/ImpH family protein [Marinilabilia salmonicolor]|jgi:hypothetical protein|uniref:Type VI secretion system (T6SS) VasB/ImpH family protein n=1 Tax=Marinilabilia salmonicolor TaxID=989 RepID=A0A368VC52_9BACT|nr:type VI secretion system (T6SS) VasB/ImpH family protein [Marinilabilia salmonicolor]